MKALFLPLEHINTESVIGMLLNRKDGLK